jgi:Putative MetA-pathway of phenol degradation
VVWQIRRNRTLRGHPRRRVGAAIGENLEGKAIELGGQYEIIERHGDGLGLAFRTLYEFSLPDDSPDEILFGPLARLVTGHDSATINTFFVGQVGDQVEIDGLELKVNWQLKRELNEKWSLGLEGFSEIEDLAHAGSFEEQQHRLGPIAYYEFAHAEGRPEWKAAGGVLFGLSDAVSDVTYKFDLEVEF